ncbi:hypothetical protein BT96DRAFT_1006452 [Gymnopus androsaceus JB14]|uniref:Uncharacterized protein n=1 Tax=Gymnopus androsaceus JB14 TaxID=1447944 RepID=A0A6A4GL43_9AGAR|nr:hypothetical protein BT96DRAFT_1006452 [Gymnopus androsaceus JB14]
MSFGSNTQSFYDYAQSLLEPLPSDSKYISDVTNSVSKSSDSEYHDAQDSDYDSKHPGSFAWEYLHGLPASFFNSPAHSEISSSSTPQIFCPDGSDNGLEYSAY